MDDSPANVTLPAGHAAQKAVICACALLSMPLGPSVCKKEGDTILEAPKVGGHMMF